MCSYFWHRMENYQGDLADIVRAGGGPPPTDHHPPTAATAAPGIWQIQSNPMNFSPGLEESADDFGDPFSAMRDPLLHELGITGPGFFGGPNSSDLMETRVEDSGSFSGGSSIFSRMLQISSPNAQLSVSPCESPVVAASPRGINKASAGLVSNDLINTGAGNKGCLVDNSGVQISSPRNPGMKRRKSQAKKVVCIPAPAPANSRPSSGEVVPSDLWAWRKYGQKPIKGSPYPRGYYRCSSSKGCSARKQVERSRTDPNMLVITYTSEHNHPWPTQRNALAGSTRSQSSKANASNNNTKSSPGSHQPQKAATSPNLKDENKESNSDNTTTTSPMVTGSSITSGSVKEEMEKQVDEGEFREGFHQSYRPALPGSLENQSEDFFAELGEIEADPLSLLFAQGFTEEDHEERETSKAGLDPFSLFDWTGNSSSSSSFGDQTRRGF